MDLPRDLALQELRKLHRWACAVACADEIDLRDGGSPLESPIDVVEQRRYALLVTGRVGGDGGEFTIDEKRPRADQEIVNEIELDTVPLHAKVHVARSSREEDQQVLGRGTIRIQHIRHTIIVRQSGSRDKLGFVLDVKSPFTTDPDIWNNIYGYSSSTFLPLLCLLLRTSIA